MRRTRAVVWVDIMGRTLLTNIGVLIVMVLVVAYGPGVTSAHASDSFEVSPKQGVTIVGKHLVEKRELWSIAWPEPVKKAAERGGMKMRVEMLDQWDDYVLAVLYLDDGVWFDITMRDTLVLCYGATRVSSSDCLAAGDATETKLFRASRNELVFDDTWKPTTRSGGYLLAFRFDEGSLPRGGQWGFERPDEVHLQRGAQ